MKNTLLTISLFIFSISSYGQEFVNGTIITQRYDTIKNVKIEKLNDAKSCFLAIFIDEVATQSGFFVFD